MSRIKQIAFWKRFGRILLFLLSLYIIFAAFNHDSVRVAADTQSCQPPTASPTNLSPNSQTFAAGTRSVTLSWSPVERATFYSINVRIGSTTTVYANSNFPGTSITIDNLKDDTSYIWSIRAFNECGSGGRTQATFTVAKAQVDQLPLVCSTDLFRCADGSLVGRDPNNNCRFFACPSVAICRNLVCPAAPSGCFYSGQLTHTCDANVRLTCGTLICQ